MDGARAGIKGVRKTKSGRKSAKSEIVRNEIKNKKVSHCDHYAAKSEIVRNEIENEKVRKS
jgi:hypothetical protein